jgi:Tetratricopeptide repeat
MICLLLFLAMVAPQLGTLEGYVFRETDGGPPRRPLTVELIEQGQTKYRKTTEADGGFVFSKVREAHYTIRARFSDFVIAEDAVTVRSGEKNFAAVMLPKRRAGARTFRTVTADQLAVQSDRDLQKKLRQAAELTAKGDLAGAVRLYEQAAAAGTQPDVWNGLGLLYFQMGRKDEAFHAFAKAMEQDPEYLLPYAHLGTIYLEERRYKDLLVVAKRALAIEMDDGLCLLGGSTGECRRSGSSPTLRRNCFGIDTGEGSRTPSPTGEGPMGSAGLRWRAQAHGTLS